MSFYEWSVLSFDMLYTSTVKCIHLECRPVVRAANIHLFIGFQRVGINDDAPLTGVLSIRTSGEAIISCWAAIPDGSNFSDNTSLESLLITRHTFKTVYSLFLEGIYLLIIEKYTLDLKYLICHCIDFFFVHLSLLR